MSASRSNSSRRKTPSRRSSSSRRTSPSRKSSSSRRTSPSRKSSSTSKNKTAKKAKVQKPAAKKAKVQKPAAKKPATKKSTAKKPATKKSTAKKPAAKKTKVQKPAAKKPAAKKTAAKKSTAKKLTAVASSVSSNLISNALKAAKSTVAKSNSTSKNKTTQKPAAKKTAAKKSTAKKLTAVASSVSSNLISNALKAAKSTAAKSTSKNTNTNKLTASLLSVSSNFISNTSKAISSKIIKSNNSISFKYTPTAGRNIQTTQDKAGNALTDLSKVKNILNNFPKKTTSVLISTIEEVQKSINRTNSNLSQNAKKVSGAGSNVQIDIKNMAKKIGKIGNTMLKFGSSTVIASGSNIPTRNKLTSIGNANSKNNKSKNNKLHIQANFTDLFKRRDINDVVLPSVSIPSTGTNFQYPGYNNYSSYNKLYNNEPRKLIYTVDQREKDIRERGYTNVTGARTIKYSKNESKFIDYSAYGAIKRFENLFDFYVYSSGLNLSVLTCSLAPLKTAHKFINVNYTEEVLKAEEKRINHTRTKNDIAKFNVGQGIADYAVPELANVVLPAAGPIYSFAVNSAVMLEKLGNSNRINLDNNKDMIKVDAGALAYGVASVFYIDRGVNLVRKYFKNLEVTALKGFEYPIVIAGATGKTVLSSVTEYLVTGEVTTNANDFGNNTTADVTMNIISDVVNLFK